MPHRIKNIPALNTPQYVQTDMLLLIVFVYLPTFEDLPFPLLTPTYNKQCGCLGT